MEQQPGEAPGPGERPLQPVAEWRAFGWFDRALEGAVALLLAAIVFVGAWQVGARYLLGSSLSWSEEFQRFGHIWLVLLAIPIGYNRGAHIGMTLVLRRLPMAARAAAAWAIDGGWLALACVVFGSTIPLMRTAAAQTTPGLGLPQSVVYAAFLASAACIAVIALRRMFRRVRAGGGLLAEERDAC